MKKILFLLLTAITLTAFTGCSKDDNGGNGSLNGTVWQGTKSDQSKTAVFTLTFSKATVVMTIDTRWNNGSTEDELYTLPYSFKGNNGVITGGGGTGKFVVNGNTLSLEDGYGDMVDFTKK